ncbi:twin-arginine translocase TatA/TatE family subunit [Aeromicrobium sp. UC242_57]|uniref:twin-arginine translocase TatA/TatE family subunit n=1 Tax=Aeromicrobium sp. UC242_57 TaxID=3374624 RepID=UPI0037BC8891
MKTSYPQRSNHVPSDRPHRDLDHPRSRAAAVRWQELPELARGSGKALRIFKTEVKAMHDDDDDEPVKPASLETIEADKKPEQG